MKDNRFIVASEEMKDNNKMKDQEYSDMKNNTSSISLNQVSSNNEPAIQAKP